MRITRMRSVSWKINWVKRTEIDLIAYLGRHEVGRVFKDTVHHRGRQVLYVSFLQLPCLIGPVEYSDNQLRAKQKLVEKVAEWLEGMSDEVPDQEVKTRIRRTTKQK